MVDTNEAYKPSQHWILLVGLGSLVWARLKTVCLTTILGLENKNCFPTLESLPTATRLPVISQSKLLFTRHRLQAAATETLRRKEKIALQKELDDLLEKRSYQESEVQKLVRGLEEQMLQSRNQVDEAKAKVEKLEAELAKANHLVSISNFDSEMDGLKKLLDDQQKLHKAKDEQIAKLENQVRLLGADNEEWTAQLNQEQYYDPSEEDDEIEEVQAPNVVSSEFVQELVVPVGGKAGPV